jgi:hypothetical protein
VGEKRNKKKYGKPEKLMSSVLGFNDKHRSMLKMGSVRLILGCCLVLIVSKVEWDELTRHPKDRGKDRLNSRTNSLQQRENDVGGNMKKLARREL